MGIIQDIQSRRNGVNAGPRFVPRLDRNEVVGLRDWIRVQRAADDPAKSDWHELWLKDEPFFTQRIKKLLEITKGFTIFDCSQELQPQALRCLPQLEPSHRFLLVNLDRCHVAAFEAESALLIARNMLSGWRLAPKSDQDPQIVWKLFDYTDVLHALLYSWVHKDGKWNYARERLCDIVQKALENSTP